jgi:transposase
VQQEGRGDGDVQAGLLARLNVAAAATVAAPEAGAEDTVIGQERWEWIRQQRSAGVTVSQIARESGLDRKTVRRCLRQRQWQPYRRPAASDTVLAAHRAWLVKRAAEVNCSARILWQELRGSRGFGGSYETVRKAVRPLRVEAVAARLTQRRFETEAGEQAQADWGQARVRFDSGAAEVHIFVLTLGYSRRCWAEGYEHERMESLRHWPRTRRSPVVRTVAPRARAPGPFAA